MKEACPMVIEALTVFKWQRWKRHLHLFFQHRSIGLKSGRRAPPERHRIIQWTSDSGLHVQYTISAQFHLYSSRLSTTEKNLQAPHTCTCELKLALCEELERTSVLIARKEFGHVAKGPNSTLPLHRNIQVSHIVTAKKDNLSMLFNTSLKSLKVVRRLLRQSPKRSWQCCFIS
jgi:hypothetical protein